MNYTNQQIADALDYAILNPMATIDDIKARGASCNKYNIKCYCVASGNVKIAADIHPNVAAVVGFPHGNQSDWTKFQESVQAIEDGANELDVVVNFGRYLGGDLTVIERDLEPICNLARSCDVKIKAILEACHYTTPQLKDACKRCADAGVHWLKTSTGFGPGGAFPEDVEVMLNVAEDHGIEVKASGGIKTYADAAGFLDQGCTRLGASRYLELCNEPTC